MKIKDLFLENLLFPVLAIILVSVISFFNKKLAFIKLTNLILSVLITSIAVGLTGFLVLLEIPFLPHLYLYIFIFYTFLGYFYMEFISKNLIHHNENINQIVAVLITISSLFTGSYLFSVIFNLSSEHHYGLIASTSTYSIILPLLLNWTFQSLTEIPIGIRKVWTYNPKTIDYDYTSDSAEKIILLELVLRRHPENTDIIKVKAKAPIGLQFGNWFQLFLQDYNAKYFDNPIVFASTAKEYDGWMFYVKKYNFLEKRFIDPHTTIHENGLKDQIIINCKRVSKSYETKNRY